MPALSFGYSNLTNVTEKVIVNYYPKNNANAIASMLIATGGDKIIVNAKNGNQYDIVITSHV